VLVEVGAVEFAQAVGVRWEVGRDPVQQDAQAGLVAAVHEGHEVLGRPVAVGGGEHAQGLVAPGGVEGVLAHRQQLQVGEAHGLA
jgi:hypothetical protein